MAYLDVAKLVGSVAGDAPSGPNLEYDPDFAALEKAAEGKPEIALGGTVSPAEPPDWKLVLRGASDLLGRSKDLRIAVLLTRALLYCHGPAAFAEGLTLLRGLLEGQWPTLHPQLDPEDDNDPTMRITAFSALVAPGLMLALRQAPLIDSRVLGPVSLSDIFPPTGSPDAARISAVFESAELAEVEALSAALAAALADLRAIDACFDAHTGSRGPDLVLLREYFGKAHQVVEQRLVAKRPAVAEGATAAGDDGAAGGPAVAPPPKGLTGDIHSREDVLKALDKICEYYERHEPTSPVPLMAQRCKRMVTMGFFEILAEVAPEGVKQAQVVMGKTDGK